MRLLPLAILTWSALADQLAVIFFHVPKTGGESVNLFAVGLGMTYIRCTTRNEYDNALRKLRDAKTWDSPDRGVLVEVHGISDGPLSASPPAFVDAARGLADLRSAVPVRLVVLTVLRQSPTNLLASAFEYFCVKRNCGAKDHSVSSLLNVSRPDPQCAYLSDGWGGFNRWKPNAPPRPSANDCTLVAEALLREADHVGETEHLGATLALLAALRVSSSTGSAATTPEAFRLARESGAASPALQPTREVHVNHNTRATVIKRKRLSRLQEAIEMTALDSVLISKTAGFTALNLLGMAPPELKPCQKPPCMPHKR
ncbi:hypothetical protein M885DRAFT_613544 [Pelagophyceae sp. CCMP2097]|nr:hypothetical protein M885DRAFT_613544 [Pelagophyceae sp. CCMP2097]|mmetsp:Transcript_22772/g.76996  ORF Transcript_22772/g.76996 Transcript_22772/m.76996 type:complete len:314 (-) Transcript_22772:29-970(-)